MYRPSPCLESKKKQKQPSRLCAHEKLNPFGGRSGDRPATREAPVRSKSCTGYDLCVGAGSRHPLLFSTSFARFRRMTRPASRLARSRRDERGPSRRAKRRLSCRVYLTPPPFHPYSIPFPHMNYTPSQLRAKTEAGTERPGRRNHEATQTQARQQRRQLLQDSVSCTQMLTHMTTCTFPHVIITRQIFFFVSKIHPNLEVCAPRYYFVHPPHPTPQEGIWYILILGQPYCA